ncbi:neuraminidase-like domain-containing protein [Wolbachia endosymbiont of Chironomus riparius]|uniref:neuraminidase-like domain-containing protein n=1 Tax=Wolbachia endosymbiont of Chironomus riparius TaxID=2883238 RepID=UPI0020A15C93|nr:neuraminidase-like domain-containing protein [Wolbachia endosymbiont of Chironomus riparius]
MTTDNNIVETTFNTKDGYNECDHCQSVLSPAAYFVKLMETIEKYIPKAELKKRRPDLFKLSLDCESTNKTKLYLEIANEIMEKNLGGNALEKLATAKYPFNLPANFPLISIRAYLEKQGISLADLYKVLEPKADNVAESLSLSPEEYKVIIDATDPNVQEVYGANANELQKVEKFIAQTNIDSDKLNRLVDCYNKLKNPPKKIYAGLENIKNLDNQALGFLHRFIRLANKLNWSFDELSDALIAIEQKEINAESLKEISKIKNLQKKLNKPLIEVCKLYSNASISMKESKSKEDANSAAESLFFLQGIKDSQLKQEYGIDEPSEPFKEQSIGEFITQNEMKREQVERLLSNYNNGQFTRSSKKIEKINTKEQRFLHNFTQLTKRLALLFDKLSKNEFKRNDTVLQKIWNISDNELTSLINYNDQVSSEKGTLPILKVHKQILLARLMNISISEMIQILLHLNINEVSASNIENIVELNDWLNKNSLTIEQLSRSVNASALIHDHVEKISKIEEELKKSEDLESEKKLDLLLNHEDLAFQEKEKIRKALEKPEIKKLKSTEKLNVLTRDSEFGAKVKGKLEVLKSKDILDALMKDSELGTKVKGILEELESKESKKLNSKEKLNKLEFDSTLLEEYKTIINEIRERINEIRERRDELHNEIHKYFNVSADVLSATHQFTKKHGINLQLLRLKDSNKNVDVAILGNKAVFIEEEKKDSVKVKMDKPRKNMAVAVIGTQTIFFGGKEDEKVSNKIDIYDAKTEKWTEHIASEGRENASVAVVNKQVIFFGGNIGNKEYSKQVDIYNSISNSWTSTTNGKSYDNVSVAIVGTKAIFFTEKKDNKKISQVYIYDSITKSWVKREGKKSSESSSNRTINSIKHCGKIDIYDNKAWKAIDIYKPDERNEIEIESDRVYINNIEKEYSIKSSITYDATVEELLNNTDVFNTLNLNAEDIKNITNYVNIYNLEGTWTEKQIKMLTNYKTLQNIFSGNELTLSQYTDWLSDSYEENKVTEKIAQLTNWNKKVLDDIKKIETFKQCFEKENNPIDSLTKIKCFMDMEEKSGIAGNILLELKDLHNLSASTGWNKYLGTEKNLKESLSYVEGVKERLENCKRDILANYMLHKYSEIKNKNMRGLYAFLLIDVEMSDCAKISPLKAGLNSLQLYIHRCILGLEEGVTVNPEFTEEMWDLLDNYREWEATKKIALYPENYLNPTLRKSATAEYKALQNTLMQGNLTDEEAANAYIQYFEDFAQLVNLNIVDTHFASEESKLYILGRTQVEPYMYYYRVGDLKSDKDTEPQKWSPWEKIETQIPVKKARVVCQYNKVFIFWLQRSEKVKDVQGVSINDSYLNVYYIFKKLDNGWSPQQRILNDIKIDEKFERKIRCYLSEKDYYENHIKHHENKKEETSNSAEKEGWQSLIDEHKKSIKELDEYINNIVQSLKNVSKEFKGELIVNCDSDKVLIKSREAGFENSEFSLEKDFTSKEVGKFYLSNSNNDDRRRAIDSINEFYKNKEEECKKENENKKQAGTERIKMKDNAMKMLEDDIAKLEKEKKEKEGLKKTLESISSKTQEQKKQKENDLQKVILAIASELDDLQKEEKIKDDVEKVKIEKVKTKEICDNLQDRLTKSKKFVEDDIYIFSSKDEVLKKLQDIEKKWKNFTDDFMRTSSKEGIRDLEIKANELQGGSNVDKLETEITKLETEIKNKTEIRFEECEKHRR